MIQIIQTVGDKRNRNHYINKESGVREYEYERINLLQRPISRWTCM